MAKELGLNPKKFGGLANHKQEPWKQPLPDFIRSLYEKRFGRSHFSQAPNGCQEDPENRRQNLKRGGLERLEENTNGIQN